MRHRTILGLVLAVAISSGVSASVRDGFQTVEFRVWREMIREGHLAYTREQFDKAFGLYVRNACMGDKHSQFVLANMFLDGKGTQADGMRAYAWFKVAAETRDPKMILALKQVEPAIPPQHKAAADALGDDYVARFGVKATGMTCKLRKQIGTNISELECNPVIDPRTSLVQIPVCEVGEG